MLVVNHFGTGITVGAVVVPQGMAYAKLAELPVQFGLYSSFMGVLVYWLFATSKDITIGVSRYLLRKKFLCPYLRLPPIAGSSDVDSSWPGGS